MIYLPFWIVSVKTKCSYNARGIFERIAPPIVKEEKIEEEYDWLVLARNATEFPTREYDVLLKGRIPF